MADAKPDSKPIGDQKAEVFAEIVTLFFVLMLIGALFNSLSSRFDLSKILSGDFSAFTPRGIILSHTTPISSLSNPIGARVISINNTDVYDSPGGKKIGTQKLGAKGKILQGPVDINGERYWYVDYDSGPDGWVKEGDIAYLESEPSIFEKIIIWFWGILSYIKIIIIVFCILCIAYIIYLNTKIDPILVNERKLLYPVSTDTEGKLVNPKWEKIMAYVDSLNENDWRIAIIEADIMLEELLDKLMLPGETIGDKLKAVEKSDFTTVDDAWAAHKIRNKISHEGQDFKVNQRDAKIAVSLYQKVFEEFEII